MGDVRFNYGPIMLEGSGKLDVFVEVSVPQQLADAIDNGDEDQLMNYDPRVGYVVKDEYFVSAYVVAGGAKLPISYGTYTSLVKDSQNW